MLLVLVVLITRAGWQGKGEDEDEGEDEEEVCKLYGGLQYEKQKE